MKLNNNGIGPFQLGDTLIADPIYDIKEVDTVDDLKYLGYFLGYRDKKKWRNWHITNKFTIEDLQTVQGIYLSTALHNNIIYEISIEIDSTLLPLAKQILDTIFGDILYYTTTEISDSHIGKDYVWGNKQDMVVDLLGKWFPSIRYQKFDPEFIDKMKKLKEENKNK